MPSAVWYVRRLAAMSPREVLFRLERAARTQLERHPRLRGRVPPPDLRALADKGGFVPPPADAPWRAGADRLLQGRIDVFALRDWPIGDPPAWNTDPKTGRSAPLVPGKLIDYRDERLVGNIKYLWEPGRHLELPALAQAYRLSGERRYLDGFVRLLDSWLEQCPYPLGVHWCSALEAGIRLINWSLAWRFAGGLEVWRELAGDAFVERWLQGVYRHMQFIDGYYSGYSSANNHLIGEAAGVYVASTTWPAWPDCGTFRKKARAILEAEAENQTHPDGVNKEQAIAYQQFVLDFFLLAGLAGGEAKDPFPDRWWRQLERMLEFVHAVMDCAGNVPMIGDADDGYVTGLAAGPGSGNFRSLLATGAILFDRADFAAGAGALDGKTEWLLPRARERYRQVAERDTRPRRPGRRAFPHGGYYILGSDGEGHDEVRAVFDAGPLGMAPLAAHGHADALSFTLSVAGVPMIVDPGTYAYHTERKWRDYFRGTAAHNTVRVDAQDQSVIGGNFLWTRHAHCTVARSELGSGDQVVEASHDGYARLEDPVTHHRRIAWEAASRVLLVEDRLECAGRHRVEIHFHFPEYAAVEEASGCITARAQGRVIRIEARHSLAPALLRGSEDPPLGWISYHFDEKRPACTLRYSGDIEGSARFLTAVAIL